MSEPQPTRGLLVAIEGADGVGKTRAVADLVKVLNQHGIPSRAHASLDTSTATGQLIESHIRTPSPTLDPRALALLFAVNRWEKQDEIRALLDSGTTVVMDRYVPSGVAYAQAQGPSPEWGWSINAGLVRPDWVFCLESKRIKTSASDVFETASIQYKVRGFFMHLTRTLSDSTWYTFVRDETWSDHDAMLDQMRKHISERIQDRRPRPGEYRYYRE